MWKAKQLNLLNVLFGRAKRTQEDKKQKEKKLRWSDFHIPFQPTIAASAKQKEHE